MDSLLEALEALIAKKRAIKQAAMQQLLTGKTRLPGFSGEWETKQLRDILFYERPDHYIVQGSDYTDSGHIPILTANKSFILGYTDEDFGVFHDCPVIVFDDFTTDCKYVTFPFKVKSSAIKILRARQKINLQFVFERMQLIHFPIGDHKRYYISEYQNRKIFIPDYDEQMAVFTVISDMDTEVVALERRLDKTRAIKQGMMQQLLTGRVRLFRPKTVAEQTATAIPIENKHNWQFNEAVVIAILSQRFGSEQYPLGRMRRTKLAYLLHRHEEGHAQGYLKKAAGPYNPQTRYGGPEKIALEKNYVRRHKNGRHQGFVAGDHIDHAERYFHKWYGKDSLQWLDQFQYRKNDDLELLTTVDMAVKELRKMGKEISTESVKEVIRGSPEWKAKLDRPVFSNAKIAREIEACRKLFASGSEGSKA